MKHYIVTSMDGTKEHLEGGKLTVEEWGRAGQRHALLVWRDSSAGSAGYEVAGDWRKSWPLITLRSWERSE